MMNSKGFLRAVNATDRQALLAVVLVLTAVAGLALLWPPYDRRVLEQMSAETPVLDSDRVRTLLRAF